MQQNTGVMAEAASSAFLRLLDLARDRSPGARARIVDSIGAFIADPAQQQNERERDIAVDILRQLLRDAELSVRRKLAERLAREPQAPITLITHLANDEAEVARPVLIEQAALGDADLIEIVNQRTMQHRLAIAMRRHVSEAICAALVDIGEEEVARTLLENPGARIGAPSFEKLVERSRTAVSLQEPLINRTDLDPRLASRMYAWVSVALRRHIVRNFDVDPTLLDAAIRDSLEATKGEHAAARARGTATDRIADAMVAARGDDPSVLLTLLRAGEIALFEATFARITGLKPLLARRTIYEPGGKALAIACRASEIDKPIFAAIFLLARQARPGDKSVDPKELQTALAFFDSLAEADARATLANIKTAAERRAGAGAAE